MSLQEELGNMKHRRARTLDFIAIQQFSNAHDRFAREVQRLMEIRQHDTEF